MGWTSTTAPDTATVRSTTTNGGEHNVAMTLQDVQVKAATDKEFRAALKNDPIGVLAAHGVEVPDGVQIEIIEASVDKLPIVIPPAAEGEISEEALSGISGGTQHVATFVCGAGGNGGNGGAGGAG